MTSIFDLLFAAFCLTLVAILAGIYLSNFSLILLLFFWSIYFIKVRRSYHPEDFGAINKAVYSFFLIFLLAVTLVTAVLARLPIWFRNFMPSNWSDLGNLFFR